MRKILKERKIDEDRKGMVGIGTMIVFIAMIIVAAVAAGVLINTSGSLQQQARATGEETIAEVSSGVRVLAAKGETDSNGTIDNIHLVVRPYAGTKGINLDNTVIQYKSDDEVNHLKRDNDHGDNWALFDESEEFVIENLQDVSDTGRNMLQTMGDIVEITIQPVTHLDPSDSAVITFYPNSGFQTTYGIQVPPTTREDSWYEL